MKTIKKIEIALLAVLMCVNFVSCSNQNDIPQEGEKVFVSLDFDGEINVSEHPLTRMSSNKDIYVVQVYYYPTGSETQTAYAYGCFSDITDVSIELYTNYTYRFCTWCFKEGMEYDSFGYLYTPNKGLPANVENKFIYSTETYYQPVVHEGLIKNGIEDYSKDYYYCSLLNFTPTTNSKLSFDMIRCVFGYSVNVENIKSGYQLKVELGKRDNIILTPEKTSHESISHFYSYTTPSGVIWDALNENKEFTQETTIKVTLVDSNSMEDIIAEESIVFTRNKMKHITVKLKEATSQDPTKTDIGFNMEETEMVSDESPITINQQ